MYSQSYTDPNPIILTTSSRTTVNKDGTKDGWYKDGLIQKIAYLDELCKSHIEITNRQSLPSSARYRVTDHHS